MSQIFLYEPEKKERVEFSGEMTITFYGEATARHSFDIELYARSLLGFNASFSKINRDLLNCKITVEIIAEEEGSLKAKIKYWGNLSLIALGGYASLVTILGYHGVQNFPFNLFTTVIEYQKIHEGNIFEIEKHIKSLELNEQEKEKFIKIITHNDFKESLDEFTYCLEKDGIDEIKISQKEKSISIHKHERSYFRAKLEDREEREEYEDIITVVNIGRGNMWRFNGVTTKRDFTASIEDAVFLNKLSLLPVSDIWKMQFSAKIVKVTITEARKKRPNAPQYFIQEMQIIPKQGELPLIEEEDK